MKLDRDQTSKIVYGALDLLLKNDLQLFSIGVSEQAITGKLACYIHQLVKNEKYPHDVDVEYNKHINEVKRVHHLREVCPNHPRVSKPLPPALRPDIVIHKRGEDGFNTIAIEAKILPFQDKPEDIANDLCKLALLTCKQGEPDNLYQYEHGLWLVFEVLKEEEDVKPHLVWFSDGDIEDGQTISDEIEPIVSVYRDFRSHDDE